MKEAVIKLANLYRERDLLKQAKIQSDKKETTSCVSINQMFQFAMSADDVDDFFNKKFEVLDRQIEFFESSIKNG